MKRFLRHPKDWISLTHIVVVIGALFTTFALQRYVGGAWWLLPATIAALAGIYTNYVAHNHSHKGISDFPAVNRVLDFLLGFTSGTPLLFWRLHHVHNHHRFEHTPDDWSSYHAFEGYRWPDKAIPLWYYCATFTPLVFCHCTIHVLRRPFSAEFWEYFISLSLLTAANVALFLWSWPAWLLTNGMIYFFAPFFLGYANYFHHFACPERRGIRSSNDFTNHVQNLLSYNIGFHIEHSMRPTMHWSELPSFHREQLAQIPAHHIEPAFFPGASAIWQSNQWLRNRLAAGQQRADFTESAPWEMSAVELQRRQVGAAVRRPKVAKKLG